MNIEFEEIINTIKGLKVFSYISYFTAILGLLATLLTLKGTSLSKVFTILLDVKNRKTVKYMICNTVRDYSFDLISVSTSLGFTYIKFFYYLFFPLGFSVTLLYILNSFENYIILIIMQIGFIIISCFAVKKFKKSENPNYKLIALIFPIIVVLQIFLLMLNYGILLIFVILGYVIFDCIIFVSVYTHIKNKVVIWTAIPRHIILYLVYYLLLRNDTPYNILPIGAILWSILLAVELVIQKMSEITILPVTIHTVEGLKTTKSRIIQYECGKIMYKLEDGTIEIINEDTVLYISHPSSIILYSIRHKLYHFLNIISLVKWPPKYIYVEYLFSEQEQEELQTYKIINYKYIKESWIRMKVKRGNCISNIVIHANKIKKLYVRSMPL